MKSSTNTKSLLFITIWTILLFLVVFCKTAESKRVNLLQNCIQTFSDETKCLEMLHLEKPENSEVILDAGQNIQLYDRGVLKNILKNKNRMYVVNLLGEPDRKSRKAGIETWIYFRPVSLHKKMKKPDREVKIRIRKGTVKLIMMKY